jgi:hypothetical protein
MSGDDLVEKGASGLEGLADKAAERGGVGEKVADELTADADFVRKLKPSLIAARARGDAPTDGMPAAPRRAPAGPQLGRRPKRRGGPNAIVVIVAAFAVGVMLAKMVDWRGHAHPKH